MCVGELMAIRRWELAVQVLQQYGLVEEVGEIIKQECVASSKLNEEERFLIEEVGIDELTIIELKVRKLRYAAEFLRREERLGSYRHVIELLIRSERYQEACEVLFGEFVPLMTELGLVEEDAFMWAARLLNYVYDESREDCIVLDGVWRGLNGERLEGWEMELIGRKLQEKWQSFALRRWICNKLIDQPGGIRTFGMVDAVPIDKLRRIEG
jgi:hypothetical protein